jgi:hypothetical protein
VALFRFSRDKRGYEYFYLVEPVTNRKGKSRTRVLYWYRTPPNIRVGRAPFDDEVRRALEARYPEITFDWAKIVEAPIPSADAEKWRERRRTDRAERAARRSETFEPRDDESAGDEAGIDRLESVADAETAPADINVQQPEAPTGAAATRKRRRRRRGGGQPPQRSPGAPPSDDSPVADLSESSDVIEPTDGDEPRDPAESTEIGEPSEE